MIAGFLVELDLHDVTLVCNDWGGAQLVVSPGDSDRVANLVLVSCEAFDNYPPGLPGRLLCLNASFGFTLCEPPGRWVSPDGVYVDLMVPDALAGPGSRGARLGPHGRRVARRAKGLEAALVDREPSQPAGYRVRA